MHSNFAIDRDLALLERGTVLGGIILLHAAALWALAFGPQQAPETLPASRVVTAFLVQAPASAPAAPPQRTVHPPKEPAARPPQPSAPRRVTAPRAESAAAFVPPPAPLPNPAQEPVPEAMPVPHAQTSTPEAAPAIDAASAADSTPVEAPTAQPRTISTGIEYVNAPRPKYPRQSRRLGEEGKVVLRVLVNGRGQAERIDVQASSGSARLDEAALEAVQRARFKPYTENGKPVSVFAIVPIAFQLQN